MSDSAELNRRFHELKGWQFEKHHGFDNPMWIYRVRGVPKNAAIVLPALHTDLNLAIAEADRQFPERIRLERIGERHVFDGEFFKGVQLLTIRSEATTRNDAILKALIAKLESGNGIAPREGL
jgi:hypothetical protein